MKAVGIYVIVETVKNQTRKRKSGLEVPVELSDRFILGKIHSVSEEIGEKEFGLEAGQEILYDKHAGHELKNIEGQDFKLISCRDVAVIL